MDERKPIIGEFNPLDSEYPIIERFQMQHAVPGNFLTPWEVETVPISSVGVVALVDLRCSIEPSVLLVRIIDSSQDPVWEYPSGSVNPEDVDLEATAKREFYEETGLTISITREDMYKTIAYENRHGIRKGGVIYFVEIPRPDIQSSHTDELGRLFFEPFAGASTEESDLLALEPWSLFLSKESLTEHPRYPRGQWSLRFGLNFWYTPR